MGTVEQVRKQRFTDNEMDRLAFFDEWLKMRWLRPEQALWTAYEKPILAKMLGTIEQPSLDLGCGDGTHSFVVCGGRFGQSFDQFDSIFVKSNAYEWTNAPQDDFHDYFSEDKRNSTIPVEHVPFQHFTVGLDWKESLLKKAELLGFYERLIQHDANRPLASLKDQEFQTIFSNIIYWIENLDPLLSETKRILRIGGKLVVTCPDANIRNAMLYKLQRDHGLEWIKDIDRGRCISYVHAYTREEWVHRFERAGLVVEDHVFYIPNLVFRIYDIGLRPLFPALVEIANTLKEKAPEDFLRLKNHWIANVRHFLLPFLDDSWMNRFGTEKHWHVFQLTRKK